MISPASPAAHLVWPICDLTEPTTQPPGPASPGSEDLRQGLDLDHVADGRARAVGLDVADRRGIDARLGIGALERPHLALEARRGQSPAAAVAGGPDPLDDGVDPIAVALGVGQPLEDHGGDALADHDAVGARRRTGGSGPAGRRPGSC